MAELYDIAWSLRAYKDLQNIRKHLTQKASSQAAKEVIASLVSSTEPLRTQPERCRKDPYLLHTGRNIRYYLKRPYRIIYEFNGLEVVIARVLHEKRNLEKVLKDFE